MKEQVFAKIPVPKVQTKAEIEKQHQANVKPKDKIQSATLWKKKESDKEISLNIRNALGFFK